MTVTAPVNPSQPVNETLWPRGMIKAALVLAGILLLSNLPNISARLHAYLSFLPLAIAGVGYAFVQLRVRPPRATLLKRLVLAATFVTWAVNQLMAAGPLAMFVGDVVIAAYVLDLFWLVQEQTAAVKSSAG